MSGLIKASALQLRDMLDVLSITARKKVDEDNYSSIFLFTKATNFGEEVGSTTFLFGASSTGSIAGTTGISVYGELSKPWILPASSRVELKAILDSWVKEDKEAEVKISVSEYGASSATLVGSEDRRVNFLLTDAEDWPKEEVYRLLSGEAAKKDKTDKDGREIPSGKRMRFASDTLAIMAKLSKKLGGGLDIIPVAHMTSVVLMEYDIWRGAFLAEEYLPDTDVDNLEVDFIDPRVEESADEPREES